MRVLLTNDDGIDATGIGRLAAAFAADPRFDPLVVAPAGDRSGTGTSLGAITPSGLHAQRVELPDAPMIESWALDAPPAMCVMAARLGGFGPPPDMVVAGINAGLNTGRTVLHSGTVGAALAAQNLGLSALAVSLEPGDPWHWDSAATLAVDVTARLADGPARCALNLNIPNRPDAIDVAWARLAPVGQVRMTLAPHDPATDATSRRLSAELRVTDARFDADTDTGLVRAGYATLTTLVGIAEAWNSATGPEPIAGLMSETVVPGVRLDRTHAIPDADRPGGLHRPAVRSGSNR